MFPLPHALGAFADCTNPGIVIIAVVLRVIIMTTPKMILYYSLDTLELAVIEARVDSKYLLSPILE